jgi:hypothetical protein
MTSRQIRFALVGVLLVLLALPVVALAVPGVGVTGNAAQVVYNRVPSQTLGAPGEQGNNGSPGGGSGGVGGVEGSNPTAGPNPTPTVAQSVPAGSSASSLPFTGFLVTGLMLFGAMLLIGGAAFRRSLAR